jgi:hypothetical protein
MVLAGRDASSPRVLSPRRKERNLPVELIDFWIDLLLLEAGDGRKPGKPGKRKIER